MGGRGAVAVTGASGFVARGLRRLLRRRGVPSVCISRRGFRAYAGEEPVVAPGYSGPAALAALRGCGALVHLVGTGRQAGASGYADVNAGLTRTVLGLARRARVKKFVFLSGLGAGRAATGYFESKLEAERAIKASGLDYTIFRPSYILGRGDHLTRSVGRQARAGGPLVPGSGRFPVQPVHVDDACEAIFRAACSGRLPRATVDLVGPRATTYARLVSAMARGPVRRVGLEEAYRRAIREPGYEFGVDDLHILVGGFVGDYGRLRDASGMEFRDCVAELEAGRAP